MLDKDLQTVSNSAYSQARDKLNYTAFEELANDTSDIFDKKIIFSGINHQDCRNQTRTKPLYIKLQHKIKGIIT